MPIWTVATTNAIRRHLTEIGSAVFTRQGLEKAELKVIAAETGTSGITPGQTLGRELQQLRDAGLLEFLGRGNYRWLGETPEFEPVSPSRGVLVLPQGFREDRPARSYRIPPQWLSTANRLSGQWIIYQVGRASSDGDYVAAGRIEHVAADPDRGADDVARIEPGSYLEFGRIVPFLSDGMAIERGLLAADGQMNRSRAARPVRAISDSDFNRIVEHGLVTVEDLLPRTDDDLETLIPQTLLEERSVWEGPVDRTTMLVSRTVRDRQFRKRVLDIYGGCCALTGWKLTNGGGRLETEAAHIMSVAAGGPDKVDNGIALAGTIHWMFDRGLISLSDAGDILLSRKINDRDSIERLIHNDRKARFPKSAAHRPHPRYLHWHRTECFHG